MATNVIRINKYFLRSTLFHVIYQLLAIDLRWHLQFITHFQLFVPLLLLVLDLIDILLEYANIFLRLTQHQGNTS